MTYSCTSVLKFIKTFARPVVRWVWGPEANRECELGGYFAFLLIYISLFITPL